jgi:hypothetical protein
MKNKAIIFVLGLIFVTMVLGCGRLFSSSGSSKRSNSKPEDNKTLTDKGVDVVVGDEKIGVPECDEVVDFFNREINNPDDDFVTKAVKQTVLNKFKEQFRQAVEENKTDKVELAKTCREFKTNLDKFKAEQDAKKNEDSK